MAEHVQENLCKDQKHQNLGMMEMHKRAPFNLVTKFSFCCLSFQQVQAQWLDPSSNCNGN